MKLFDKLSGKIDQFVQSALRGPANCQIKISKISELYNKLTDKLKAKGLSTSEVIDIVNTKLLGVCPKCATWTSGQGIGLLSSIKVIGPDKIIPMGPTGGAERLMEGLCRNNNCSSTDILIFWRPDEDDKAAERIAKMGIQINRQQDALKYEKFDRLPIKSKDGDLAANKEATKRFDERKKNATKMRYFECKVPSGDGLCSDDNCPCPETVIPRGTGYLYIPQSIVDFRRRYPTLQSAKEALQRGRMEEGVGYLVDGTVKVWIDHRLYPLGRWHPKLQKEGGFISVVRIDPILVCEQGAKLRNLDLEIAAADAKYMWKTGKAPLRATPLAGSIREPAIEHLIPALKDKDSDVRWNAAEALGKIKDTKAVEPLIQALKDEDSNVRERVAEALVKIREPAVEPLIHALKDKDNGVRWNAAETLGKIKDTKAVEPLIQALKDEDSNVRGGAVWALGKIKDTKAVEPLIQALKDEDSNVRRGTVWALREIKDTKAVEPIIQALNDEDSYVRYKVAEALGNIRDERAVEYLIQALKDENIPVRKKVAEALVRIGEPAIEPLTKTLKDEDKNVQEAAKEALEKIKESKEE